MHIKERCMWKKSKRPNIGIIKKNQKSTAAGETNNKGMIEKTPKFKHLSPHTERIYQESGKVSVQTPRLRQSLMQVPSCAQAETANKTDHLERGKIRASAYRSSTILIAGRQGITDTEF